MESVELLCDQVALIHKSKKILDGPIKEVKNRFKPGIFTVALSSLNQELPAAWKVDESDDGNYRFTLALNGSTPNQLLRELMEYGEVAEFKEQIPSMEELFIHLVKTDAHE